MLSSKMDNMVCISFKIKNIYTLPKFILDKLDTLDIKKANYIIDYQLKIKNNVSTSSTNENIEITDDNNIVENILSRNDILIKNNYQLLNDKNSDQFHIVCYFLNNKKIQIIIRRLDSENGWMNDLKIRLFDEFNRFIVYMRLLHGALYWIAVKCLILGFRR